MKDESRVFYYKEPEKFYTKEEYAEHRKNLYILAQAQTDKLEANQPITLIEYVNVLCPRCGGVTKGNGQKNGLERMCKFCDFRIKMKNYFSELSTGKTPLGYFLVQFLKKRDCSIIKHIKHPNISESSISKIDVQKEKSFSGFVSEPANQSTFIEPEPADAPSLDLSAHSESKINRENIREDRRNAADRKDPEWMYIEPSSEKIPRHNYTSEDASEEQRRCNSVCGFKKLLELSEKDAQVYEFLKYVQEVLAPLAKQQAYLRYSESVSSMVRSESGRWCKEYYFIEENISGVMKSHDMFRKERSERKYSTEDSQRLDAAIAEKEMVEYLERKGEMIENQLYNIKESVRTLKVSYLDMKHEQDVLKKEISQVPLFRMPGPRQEPSNTDAE